MRFSSSVLEYPAKGVPNKNIVFFCSSHTFPVVASFHRGQEARFKRLVMLGLVAAEEGGDGQRKEGSTKSWRPGQAFPTVPPSRDLHWDQMGR